MDFNLTSETREALHKFAEAMRIGSQGTFQCRGSLFESSFEGVGCCALGAVYRANHMDLTVNELCAQNNHSNFHFIFEPFGLSAKLEIYPDGYLEYYVYRTLDEVIWHLNDSFRWSREEIADWLDAVADGRTFWKGFEG